MTTVCAICVTWFVSFCRWTRWATLSHIADVVRSCSCLVFGFIAGVFLAAPAELPSCSALRLWQDLCRTVARFESGSALASHLPRFSQFCVFSVFFKDTAHVRARPLDFAGDRVATVTAWSSILSTSAVNARRCLCARFVSRSAADFVCWRCSADCGMILVGLLQVLTLLLRLPSRSYSLHHCVSFAATPCMSVHTR